VKRCRKCDKSFQEKDTFCNGCGGTLDRFPKCSHCDAEIHPFDKFCTNCGRPSSDERCDYVNA
jgi:predicted amidophosphoribosyltransferase